MPMVKGQSIMGVDVNPCPAYTLLLQTMQIQISWLLKKPTDLDLQFVIQYVILHQQPGSSNLIG